jgi:Spy/CpxP family protein refolding chaperone
LALLTPEQRAKFDEDEALIRRDKEAQNAQRQEVRAAKKRKRDAVEEAKIRLVEKEAKDKREAY